MGYSSSAALFVSSEGHSLQDKIGIIPVTETIFTNFNMSLALITLIIITIINPLMRPTRKIEIKEINTNIFNINQKKTDSLSIKSKNRTLAQILENNRLISTFAGASLLFFIFYFFKKRVFIRFKYSQLVIFGARVNFIFIINSLCKIN